MLPDVLTSLSGAGILLTGAQAPKGFLETLPDPMRPDLPALLFVMVLITLLFFFLKYVFFKPIIKVMDDRDEAIQSGASRRAEAGALVEARQAAYGAQLKELRAKAFEHRKALAGAAAREKQVLVDQARAEAAAHLAQALEGLRAGRDAAKADLLAQVDALSESMVSHLLRQA